MLTYAVLQYKWCAVGQLGKARGPGAVQWGGVITQSDLPQSKQEYRKRLLI